MTYFNRQISLWCEHGRVTLTCRKGQYINEARKITVHDSILTKFLKDVYAFSEINQSIKDIDKDKASSLNCCCYLTDIDYRIKYSLETTGHNNFY